MRRYRALIRSPHGRRLLVGAAVFYPGQTALGLVLLLSVHRATGSFATAGAATAVDTTAFAVSSIFQGRLVDRRGPRALAAMTVMTVLAIAALDIAFTVHETPAVLVGLTALVGGSIPAAGPALRAVWSSELSDPDERATAFAYQSLTQDAGFVIGPAAFGALATAVSPVLALSGCAALIATGTLTVATVPSPPHSTPRTSGAGTRSLVRTLAPLALTLAAVGVALGAVDVSAAAFAAEHHRQQLSGVLLAAFSAGSVAGGFAYGARSWNSGLRVRLITCAIALGVLDLAPVAAPNLAVGVPIFVVAGVPLAATLTTAFLLAGELAPAGRETEAYALITLALNAGAAFGGALSGQLVAGGSARPGFLIASVSPLLGALALGLSALISEPAARPTTSGRTVRQPVVGVRTVPEEQR